MVAERSRASGERRRREGEEVMRREGEEERRRGGEKERRSRIGGGLVLAMRVPEIPAVGRVSG